MGFTTRNAYHLRISAHSVLPLYVYLDQNHVHWMSDPILQMVLADLRPLIIPKLRDEQDTHFGPNAPLNAKKGSVDVHRGDSYQFAFFFRKVDAHNILVKTRKFVVAPKKEEPVEAELSKPTAAKTCKGKRKRAPGKATNRGRGRGRGRKTTSAQTRQISNLSDEEEIEEISSSSSKEDTPVLESVPRRSRRAAKLQAGTYREDDSDVEITEAPPSEIPNNIGINPDMDGLYTMQQDDEVQDDELIVEQRVDPVVKIEEELTAEILQTRQTIPPMPPSQLESKDAFEVNEEDKPKLAVRLKYQGFPIYGRSLCVVVEPWPLVPNARQQPAVQRTLTDLSPSWNTVASQRAETPLFINDGDSRWRSVTPMPPPSNFSALQVETVAAEPRSTQREDWELLQLSQILRDTGGDRAGGDEEEDGDGAIFMGDADERNIIF